MKIVAMKSKIIANDGKIYPLFAIVDQCGRTIIQVKTMELAEALLRDL